MVELAGSLCDGPHSEVQEHVLNSREAICGDISSETDRQSNRMMIVLTIASYECSGELACVCFVCLSSRLNRLKRLLESSWRS